MTPDIGILWEDDGLLVCRKPSGLAVIPERWEEEAANLVDILRKDWPEGVNLHRIDKEASGLVAFAKNPESARYWHSRFDAGQFRKTYHAIANGKPVWTEQECAEALEPDGDRMHRTVVDPRGRNARSRFRVMESFRDFCLLEVEIFTGRTHQIRAHARHLGFPLAGDRLYGGGEGIRLSMIKRGWKGDSVEEPFLIRRTALHAARLEFTAPDGTPVRVEAPWPRDFEVTLKQLRRWN